MTMDKGISFTNEAVPDSIEGIASLEGRIVKGIAKIITVAWQICPL